MKTIGKSALPALAATALLAFPAHGAGDKKGSLKQQVVGAWTMKSNVLDQGGTKTEPYGSDAKGSVILTSNGRVALVITRTDIPKFASNNRTTGTAEENKAAVAGSIAYFGTYTVNEPGKMLIMQLEGCSYPNWVGTEQKRTLELSGDELKFINQAPSMGQGTITVTWKRVKEARTTASAAGPRP
ncbi:MAG TPA: lipocalin-like domain-containing protein [Myxococcales bacterium]|nr:lipocalin-like domain-containing protein [Myxococcales bacterium]